MHAAAGLVGATSTAFDVSNPAPVLTGLDPIWKTAGGAEFTLTASGSGFVNGSKVLWGGVERPTVFQSATELTATIPAADIAEAVRWIATLPEHVNIDRLVIRPRAQAANWKVARD